ncbi:MAG TPA: mandelate racemase/muconate lactonizing enzyme family protein [Lachnospiraceae bacterium]|nr:mandelate racemase/muconate lactonizing enzyme family protein [Lachnospiraceae bacterium]
MKIKKIETYILRVPLGEKRFFSSQCAFPERNSLLVRIETEEGIYGWGEGGQYGPPEPVKACIEHVLAPLLIGRDPLDKAVLWHEMYNHTRDFGQKGTYIEAISAIDIALWDICGKALHVSVSQLIGGCQRKAVEMYATGCYYRGEHYLDLDRTVKELGEEAAEYVRQGFHLLKIKVGLLPVEEDAKRVQAIRENVGPDVDIFVDCNHSYNANTAVRMGRYLEEYGILFMEEPVVPEDLEGYRFVRDKLDIAIAGGEAEYTLNGFRHLIENGCIDIAQPDICVTGGLTEFQRILAFAQAYGVQVIPHAWGSGIAFATALSALSAIPVNPHTANPVPLQNEPVIEYDRNFNPLRDELLTEPVSIADGKVVVPQGSGLGVDIDRTVLEKYMV